MKEKNPTFMVEFGQESQSMLDFARTYKVNL